MHYYIIKDKFGRSILVNDDHTTIKRKLLIGSILYLVNGSAFITTEKFTDLLDKRIKACPIKDHSIKVHSLGKTEFNLYTEEITVVADEREEGSPFITSVFMTINGKVHPIDISETFEEVLEMITHEIHKP